MNNKSKKYLLGTVLMLITALFLFSGCIPETMEIVSDYRQAGFFRGFWHGIIAWISLIVGLFTSGQFTIYEVNNSGWLYNLGFLIGAGSSISGLGLTLNFNVKRSRKKKNKQSKFKFAGVKVKINDDDEDNETEDRSN